MKQKILILAVVFIMIAGTALAFEAPAELDIYGAVEIPGFAFGPMADFLYFPLSIDIGSGAYNRLGFGASTGAFITLSPFGITFPVQGIFAGRFEMIPDFPFDWDVRLGAMIGQTAVMYGSTGILLHFDNIRIGGELTFRPQLTTDTSGLAPSYGTEWLISFILSFGFVTEIEGMKGIKI